MIRIIITTKTNLKEEKHINHFNTSVKDFFFCESHSNMYDFIA